MRLTGSKKSLNWLITLMTISLLGVTGIQAYWLNNAYRLEEEKFDQEVSRAMEGVALRLETLEAINFLSDNIKLEPFFNSSDNPMMGIEGRGDSSLRIQTAEGTYSVAIRLGEDSINVYENQTEKLPGLYYSTKDTSYRVAFADRQKLQGKFNTMDRIFNQLVLRTIDRSQGSVVARVRERHLDSILTYEFKSSGIDLPFHYKVEEDDQAVFVSEGWVEPDSTDEFHQAALFPNDFFNRATLKVSFVGETNYLLRSIWLTLLVSLLFTGAMIYTFGRTLSFSVRQKRISEIKTDFINNMTHEFKTPIATINLAIDSLKNPKVLQDEERVKYYSELIRQENNRMNMQVEGVLRMALMDKKEMDFKVEAIPATEVVQDCLKHIHLQLESRKGQLQTHFRDKGALVKMDKNHFSNAVINLLDNALKYSKGVPHIEVFTERSERHFILIVSDRGIGMSKEEQKHIFDRFYRVESGNIHNIKGHGLGLSYVHGVVEAHDGKIEVNSEKGKGSTFYLYLPLADN